jgi:hypothetical protein
VRRGTNQLEERARWLFNVWAVYRRHTRCDGCEAMAYCGAARPRGRWLCFACFDLSAEADRMAR